MRCVLALIALTGCTQLFGLDAPSLIDSGVAIDSRDIDAPSADMPPAAPFCDVSDSTLRACFPFEVDTNSHAAAALTVTASNYSFATGHTGMGIKMIDTTVFTIDESTALDVTAVTMEAWVIIKNLPATGTRMGVWDTDGQYSIFIHDDGSFSCSGSGVTLATTAGSIVTQTWTHLACAVDASSFTLYKDGVATVAGTGNTLAVAPNTGSSLGGNAPSGDRLVGQIDQLRVYSTARTATQIAADASN